MKKGKGEIISMHYSTKGEFEIIENCLIITLGEDLDHHNAVSIREQADKIIMSRNIKYIIFDFSETDFMDSSGIGAIMGRYKKVNSMGGSVFVTGISKNIDRILKLSGIYKIVDRYDTVREALDIIDNKNY